MNRLEKIKGSNFDDLMGSLQINKNQLNNPKNMEYKSKTDLFILLDGFVDTILIDYVNNDIEIITSKQLSMIYIMLDEYIITEIEIINTLILFNFIYPLDLESDRFEIKVKNMSQFWNIYDSPQLLETNENKNNNNNNLENNNNIEYQSKISFIHESMDNVNYDNSLKARINRFFK